MQVFDFLKDQRDVSLDICDKFRTEKVSWHDLIKVSTCFQLLNWRELILSTNFITKTNHNHKPKPNPNL